MPSVEGRLGGQGSEGGRENRTDVGRERRSGDIFPGFLHVVDQTTADEMAREYCTVGGLV